PDPPTLARPRRERLIRDVLLRVSHAVLPGPGALGPWRPHADPLRAAPLRRLARERAAVAEPETRRHHRRPRREAPPRPRQPRVRRPAVRARDRHVRSPPPPIRCERLAERRRKPRAARLRARADPDRAGRSLRLTRAVGC